LPEVTRKMALARERPRGIEAVIDKYSTAFMTCAAWTRRTVLIRADSGAGGSIC
jgi:hypothetical protein